LISGYLTQEPSPYSFGAAPPPLVLHNPSSLERWETDRTLATIKAEARKVPDVRGAELRWFEAISSLKARGGTPNPCLRLGSTFRMGFLLSFPFPPGRGGWLTLVLFSKTCLSVVRELRSIFPSMPFLFFLLPRQFGSLFSRCVSPARKLACVWTWLATSTTRWSSASLRCFLSRQLRGGRLQGVGTGS